MLSCIFLANTIFIKWDYWENQLHVYVHIKYLLSCHVHDFVLSLLVFVVLLCLLFFSFCVCLLIEPLFLWAQYSPRISSKVWNQQSPSHLFISSQYFILSHELLGTTWNTHTKHLLLILHMLKPSNWQILPRPECPKLCRNVSWCSAFCQMVPISQKVHSGLGGEIGI